jgi:hypothetical protein
MAGSASSVAEAGVCRTCVLTSRTCRLGLCVSRWEGIPWDWQTAKQRQPLLGLLTLLGLFLQMGGDTVGLADGETEAAPHLQHRGTFTSALTLQPLNLASAASFITQHPKT